MSLANIILQKKKKTYSSKYQETLQGSFGRSLDKSNVVIEFVEISQYYNTKINSISLVCIKQKDLLDYKEVKDHDRFYSHNLKVFISMMRIKNDKSDRFHSSSQIYQQS
ncbi:hypothetical protein ABPG72_010936 [Tetrahymena utriculariae]